jgi:hypothetical protein
MVQEVILAEPETTERCAWCGQPAEDLLMLEDLPACGSCAANEVFKGLKDGWSSERKPLPPKQRFEALCEAARALLKEGVGHEDLVIPTLAFANGVGEGYVDLADAQRRLLVAEQQGAERWEAEVDRFVRACPTFRPNGVVDGVVMLERLSVSVKIHNYAHPEIVMPKMVTGEVSPSFRMTKPEHVAALYERVLTSAGIPCTEGLRGAMRWRFNKFPGHRLLIDVEHSYGSEARVEHLAQMYPGGKPVFSHPSTIREYYKMLMGKPEGPGFAPHLVGRSRGYAPAADTVVPACVAAYLRYNGGIEGRKEIHGLLNEHVLCGTWKVLPEKGYSSSAVNQLWRDVERVQRWTRYADDQLFA